MTFGLPKLSSWNHGMLVVLLVLAGTGLISDMTIPDAVRMKNAGHLALASVLSFVPLLAFIASVIVLSPRTGNDSRRATMRAVGQFPLLVRFIIVMTVFYAMAAAIKRLAG